MNFVTRLMRRMLRRPTEQNVVDVDDDSDAWSTDSGVEGLGALNEEVDRRKIFIAKIHTNADGMLTISLAPSSVRQKTDSEQGQGDHSSAQTLILQTIANFSGRNVKELATLFYDMASDVFPNRRVEYKTSHDALIDKLFKQRTIRKDTIEKLKNDNFIHVDEVEASLLRDEARIMTDFIEDAVNQFVTDVNAMEGSAHMIGRKGKFPIKKAMMIEIMNKLGFTQEAGFRKAQNAIEKIIEPSVTPNLHLTQKARENIVDKLQDKFSQKSFPIPKKYFYRGGVNKKILKQNIKEKVRELLPKEYAVKADEKDSERDAMKNLIKEERERKLTNEEVGKHLSELFDYPRVEKDELNDQVRLYKLLARHVVLSFHAFKGMRDFDIEDKKSIYNAFLNEVLENQFWKYRQLNDKDGNGWWYEDDQGNEKPYMMDREALKEGVNQFAHIDFSTNDICLLPSKSPFEIITAEERTLIQTKIIAKISQGESITWNSETKEAFQITRSINQRMLPFNNINASTLSGTKRHPDVPRPIKTPNPLISEGSGLNASEMREVPGSRIMSRGSTTSVPNNVATNEISSGIEGP